MIYQVYQSQEVGQSYLTSLATTLYAMVHVSWLVACIRPRCCQFLHISDVLPQVGYTDPFHILGYWYRDSSPSTAKTGTMILLTLQLDVVRASPLRACSICGPARIFLTSKFLVIYFFPTSPINLKLSSLSDVMKLP
jgi:hypothetical protein